jgi:hypothetical protein
MDPRTILQYKKSDMRNQSQRDLDAFQEIGQLFPTIFVCI